MLRMSACCSPRFRNTREQASSGLAARCVPFAPRCRTTAENRTDGLEEARARG